MLLFKWNERFFQIVEKLHLTPSIQVPPFSQESPVQSLILLLHVVPSNPVSVQSHEKAII